MLSGCFSPAAFWQESRWLGWAPLTREKTGCHCPSFTPTYLSVCFWVPYFLCFTCSVCGSVAKPDSSAWHVTTLFCQSWTWLIVFASWRKPCHCSQTKGGPLPSQAHQLLMLSAPCVYAASRQHSTQRCPAQMLSVYPAFALCPVLPWGTGILLTWKGSNETWWNRSWLDWLADLIIILYYIILYYIILYYIILYYIILYYYDYAIY